MLRASSQQTQVEVDLQGIEGDAQAAAVGIAHGAELMALAEAVARRDEPALAAARAALLAAAGVAANFMRMVRIADSIGIPVDNLDTDLSRAVRSRLDLGRFASARNTHGQTPGAASADDPT